MARKKEQNNGKDGWGRERDTPYFAQKQWILCVIRVLLPGPKLSWKLPHWLVLENYFSLTDTRWSLIGRHCPLVPYKSPSWICDQVTTVAWQTLDIAWASMSLEDKWQFWAHYRHFQNIIFWEENIIQSHMAHYKMYSSAWFLLAVVTVIPWTSARYGPKKSFFLPFAC